MQNKEKIQFVITAVLIVVLIGLIIFRLQGKKPTPVYQASNPAVTVPVSLDTGVKNTGSLYAKLADEASKMDIKRDPFSKLAGESATTLFLNGIAWDEVTPQAIINNEILEVGGSVNGNTVVEIKEDGVVLSNGKSTFELKIPKEK